MPDAEGSRRLDLEDRTFAFARRVIRLTRFLPKSIANVEVMRQLVRAAGSVGANYIEANEALSKKDFLMRVKICRKEAKESHYWLRLLDVDHPDQEDECKALLREATELTRIFGAILTKSE